MTGMAQIPAAFLLKVLQALSDPDDRFWVLRESVDDGDCFDDDDGSIPLEPSQAQQIEGSIAPDAIILPEQKR